MKRVLMVTTPIRWAELATVQHAGLAERHHRYIDDRARFVQSRILEVPDDKCIVTLTLRSNRVTYHLPGTAHLDQAVGIRVKGRDAANIDGGTRISDFF